MQDNKSNIPVVGSRVSVVAKVTKVFIDKLKVERVVLEDIYINGEYFKDHSWIKMSKRLENAQTSKKPRKVKTGDIISATAEISEYLNGSCTADRKLGLKTFRHVVVTNEG